MTVFKKATQMKKTAEILVMVRVSAVFVFLMNALLISMILLNNVLSVVP